MKTILTILLAITCLMGYSQTPPVPPDVPTTNLGNEKFGISSGAITEGENIRAQVMIDYTLNKTFFLRGEVQSSQSSSAVELLAAGGGVHKSWETARVYGVGEFGWNWPRNQAEFFAGGGAAWQPVNDGILQRFSLYVESGIVLGLTSNIGSESPRWRNSAGIRYSF